MKVESRNETFATRPPTRIWQETPDPRNPYLAKYCHCHGYEIEQLMQQRGFVAVFYLLFRGELPNHDQAQLLERLMIALINPGPRHAATRAAMNAGIGRTATAHILPIALSVQGGAHLGGAEVEAAMRFIAANQSLEPAAVLTAHPAPESPGDKRPFPGFGSLYGGIDPLAARFAAHLARLPGAGGSLAWGNAVAEQLREEGMGWLLPGLAAAVFCDLGFPARAGAGLFQLLTAPGLLAHGLEMATRPITAMPFLDAEHYVIEPN